MSTVVTIIGALVFFALIMVSVGLHEVGHFIPGKLFGVKVTQFFIGFGKNLWSRQVGETEYGVKLFPLGGYVRLLGMYPPRREGKDTWLKRLADSAREAEWEEITDTDVADHRLFYQQPLWRRLIIMFSGVGMNLLLAFALFAGVNLGYGQGQLSLTIAAVQQCVDPAAATCQPTPAAAMGLQPQDRVVAMNGQSYATWAELTSAIRANGASPIQVDVVRAGQPVSLPSVPGGVTTVADSSDPTATIDVGYLGVTSQVERVKIGLGGTAAQMWQMTTQAFSAIVALPVTTVRTVGDLVTGQPRDVNSPISIVGASVIAGDVASADAPWGARIASYVSLLGSINLFVGLMNLVPLPPFDGGQIAAGLWEGLRRVWAKLTGKAPPPPVDTARLLPVTYLVGGLLLLIGVVLILADIISPVPVF
ncbi:MAG: site-2 protease family protein [Propionibacteriaceae bacterium]|jgi:membrane-associated protease RseP (regulator of RpoE activity)|nr:site-2 protease family protein [Propionibacteriaceae bacterium]